MAVPASDLLAYRSHWLYDVPYLRDAKPFLRSWFSLHITSYMDTAQAHDAK